MSRDNNFSPGAEYFAEYAAPILKELLKSQREIYVAFKPQDDIVYADMTVNEHPPVIVDLGTNYFLDGKFVENSCNEDLWSESPEGVMFIDDRMLKKVVLTDYSFTTDGFGGDQSNLHFRSV